MDNIIKEILRSETSGMFSDDWYYKTSVKILNKISLDKEGVLTKTKIDNILKLNIDKDLILYFDSLIISSGDIIDKNLLYKNFKVKNVMSQRSLTKYFAEYLSVKGFDYIERKSNKKRYIQIL